MSEELSTQRVERHLIDSHHKLYSIFDDLSFKSKNKTMINADCNGSYNILRKAFPEAFSGGIEGVGLHPMRVNVVTMCKRRKRKCA
ncbi:transposase [Bacillus fengqiuensis]|nr:transposase [Bacillus fengqiuensis]